MLHIGNNFQLALRENLARARHTVDATIYCISPLATSTNARHKLLHHAFSAAKQRGVMCRAVIANLGNMAAHGKANTAAAEQLKSLGWYIRRAKSIPLLHAKVWIFDSERVMIGSHNMTDSALHLNLEISLSTTAAHDVQPICIWFNALWQSLAPHHTGDSKNE